jgi:hypothetical protein
VVVDWALVLVESGWVLEASTIDGLPVVVVLDGCAVVFSGVLVGEVIPHPLRDAAISSDNITTKQDLDEKLFDI